MGKLLKEINQRQRHTVQLWTGVFVAIVGCILFIMGFYAIPIGEISASVLTAGAEFFTFSGALIGIDSVWRSRNYQARLEYQDKINQMEMELIRDEDEKD